MSGLDQREHHGVQAWLRTNWQVIAGILAILGTGYGVVKVDAMANQSRDDRLAQVEKDVRRGEERDTTSVTTIADLSKRADSRAQELFATLSLAIHDASKHSDSREMEIFTSLNKDISDMAGRIDAQERRFTELRHIRDMEQSDMRERIRVLETQLQFFADHLDVSRRVPSPMSGRRP